MNFSEKLIDWFEKNKRDLPWRNTKNPYFIWLSEIILQQTRVEQGLPYYLKFIKNFPTVQKLSAANEEKVLKLWQGLGYYTRARNLHHTAKYIAESLSGKFPNRHEDILKLKGIGKYTAAAIASFAFDLPHAVVDGNVKRVLSRIFGISEANSPKAENKFYEIAGKLMDKKNPSAFNQAIMEFGAVHCTPQNPQCEICIFKNDCAAFKLNRVLDFPAKSKKIKQRNRFFYYLIIENKNKIFIRKRTENDIWKNLYEFPKIESERKLIWAEIFKLKEWRTVFRKQKIQFISLSKKYKHILSHQKIFAQFLKIKITEKQKNNFPKSFWEIKKSALKNYPVPRLMERFLEDEINEKKH